MVPGQSAFGNMTIAARVQQCVELVEFFVRQVVQVKSAREDLCSNATRTTSSHCRKDFFERFASFLDRRSADTEVRPAIKEELDDGNGTRSFKKCRDQPGELSLLHSTFPSLNVARTGPW
jgi:hypothetical protein